MILVVLGTSEMVFPRLIQALMVSKYASDMVLQRGVNEVTTDQWKDCSQYWSRSEMLQLIAQADLVISHAGIGSILDCLSLNKKIILVERQCDLGESMASQAPAIDYFLKYTNIDVCRDFSDLDVFIENKLSASQTATTEMRTEHRRISSIIQEFLLSANKANI